MIECGDRLKEPHSIIHQRKSLRDSTLRRGLKECFITPVESQLVVLGQALTLGSTPKATLFEPGLFRKFVANPWLTESYDEGVAFGLTETEKDSELDMRRPILEPSHDGPHDAHHVADQPCAVTVHHNRCRRGF